MNVVITGGSSGLGAGLGRELARRGHRVGLIARREAELRDVVARITQEGGVARYAVADVTDRDGLFAAVRAIEAEHGPTDLMVANAGAGGPTPASRIDGLKIARMMRLNFEGVVYAFEAVLPAMVARHEGHVAAVSSLAGFRGLPPAGTYSAAKAAVTTLCEAFSAELRPKGIAVTTIHPGFVKTPILDGAKHPTPFLMDVERASRIMADGLLARRRDISFPWQTTWLMRFAALLPRFLFEPLLSKLNPG